MADTQIRGLGSGSAPLSYTVPGSQEIVLKSLFAAFDGSAAAAAFLPCVRLIAPGGGVVAEYITDASVAAGSSAEVSFAPFLRGASTSTPPASTATDFGPPTWEIPVWNLHGAANILCSTNVDWVYNATPSSGGYVTRATPAVNAFFVVLVALHPQSSIWGFTYTWLGGSDFGVISADIASISYQPAARSVGNPAGKIQDIFSSGANVLANYGANPVFLNLIDLDCYGAAPIAESNYPGTITFIPGGAEGAVLSNLSSSTDPYTGFSISDGGPGWYALRFQVRAKNAASSNYRFQIPRVSVLRVADGEGF